MQWVTAEDPTNQLLLILYKKLNNLGAKTHLNFISVVLFTGEDL